MEMTDENEAVPSTETDVCYTASWQPLKGRAAPLRA